MSTRILTHSCHRGRVYAQASQIRYLKMITRLPNKHAWKIVSIGKYFPSTPSTTVHVNNAVHIRPIGLHTTYY